MFCGNACSNLALTVCRPQVGGLPTNLGFLQRLAAHPAFQAAELDTSFIKQHEAALMSQPRVSDVLAACAALAYHLWQVQQVRLACAGRLCAGWCLAMRGQHKHLQCFEVIQQPSAAECQIVLSQNFGCVSADRRFVPFAIRRHPQTLPRTQGHGTCWTAFDLAAL